MKSEENRGNCITIKFTICNLHQVLLNLRVKNSRRMRYKEHVAHDLRRRIKSLEVVCGQTSLKIPLGRYGVDYIIILKWMQLKYDGSV
jgi:hypothetical protein